MKPFRVITTVGCAIILCIISIVVYKIFNEHYYEGPQLIPPIINDVFKEHRKETNITIYEMNELFLTFTNINTDKDDDIIFYTINSSDPRKYGIPYDDNEESEIGIAIPISKVTNVYKPVTVHAVIGRLGSFDQIIWSKVTNQSFWNPNHLNHTKFGGGFSKIPQILSGTHTIGNRFIVRVWPQRLTDIIKCCYSNNNDAKILKKKKSFWSDKYSSKTINVSQLYLFHHTYIDIVFDDDYLKNINSLIYIRCSTSSKSVSETERNPDYSSMLIPTKPKYTQLFPPNNDKLGKIIRN